MSKSANTTDRNPQTQTMENNPPTYHTRYGIVTAAQAAEEALNSAWARIRFLEDVFDAVSRSGDNFPLEEFSSQGLAAILRDIAIDVQTGHFYHVGDDPTPGKTDDLPVVQR